MHDIHRYRNVMAMGHENLGVHNSAVEGTAIEDVLRVSDAPNETEHEIQENQLDRISAMLTKLGGQGYFVQEDGVLGNWEPIYSDPKKSEPRQDIRGELGRGAYRAKHTASRACRIGISYRTLYEGRLVCRRNPQPAVIESIISFQQKPMRRTD